MAVARFSSWKREWLYIDGMDLARRTRRGTGDTEDFLGEMTCRPNKPWLQDPILPSEPSRILRFVRDQRSCRGPATGRPKKTPPLCSVSWQTGNVY
jgi:hypothetical protein